MAEQPTGTVTFLFTDIEGSTRLLERLGAERYAESLQLHHRLVRHVVAQHGGYEVDSEGDAFFVAFDRAGDAVAAAAASQQALAAAAWPDDRPIRVRMGIHTGEPLTAPPKYVGLDVHKAARVMAAGHGGQVLISAATRRLLGDDAGVVDLGEHRLKDLSQAEPLYQLVVDGLPCDFPALKTLGNHPTNLPVVATPFVGRERELSEVLELLRQEDVRLLTLTGVGGIGKTRLALQAASDAFDRFPDGVYWVPLAPVRDAALVLQTVAQTLGLRAEPGEPVLAPLARHLREKRLLLLLDNLEHVVEAAPDVAALLAAAPAVQALATSRERLRVGGEQVYDVAPFSVTADRGDADTLDAVELFAARAHAADAGFALTDANAAAVAELVRRLEGVPLAIELAAARIRALPPEAMLARLSRRLQLLTRGGRDVPERQRTMEATIRWSYDLLSPDEKTLLKRLSVCVGGCRLEAAEAVCDPDQELAVEVVDGIESLLDKSLLRRRDDPDGTPRYWLLETIREFASAQLLEDPDEGEATLVRYAETFAGVARDVGDGLRGSDTAATLARADAEVGNIRAVFALADERRLDDLTARLIRDTAEYWHLRGLVEEGAAHARRAIERTDGREDQARIDALRAAFYVRPGDAALELVEEGIRLSRRHDDGESLRVLLLLESILLSNSNRFEEARAAIAEYVRLADDPHRKTIGLDLLGDAALSANAFLEAAAIFEQVIEHASAVGDEVFLAGGHANLGTALVGLGELERAVEAYVRGIGFAERTACPEYAAWATAGLAAVAATRGALDDAALLLGYSDEKLRQHGFDLGPNEERLRASASARVAANLPEEQRRAAFERGRALAGETEFAASVLPLLTGIAPAEAPAAG